MRKVTFLVALLAIVAIPSFAVADLVDEPTTGFGGHFYYDLTSGASWRDDGISPRLAGDVYNNTNPAAAANFGFSSTSLTSIFGDRVTTTGTGILDQNDFTIFNSSSGGATRPLLTASFNVCHYDAATNPPPPTTPFGCYTTGVVNFGAGLATGFFSIVTVTGLAPANINVSTTDVLITQQVASSTFGAGAGTSRLGIASLDPPTIGSSTNVMYINSSTVGPAGYYNIGNPPANANPGYRITLPEPSTLALLGLGSLALIRRRR